MPAPKKPVKTHRVAVQKRNLISLPREIREKLMINEGDVLDIKIEGTKIVLEPYKLIPSSQAYFWTEATQEDMLEAKKDVKSGRVRQFSNMDEFMKDLGDD